MFLPLHCVSGYVINNDELVRVFSFVLSTYKLVIVIANGDILLFIFFNCARCTMHFALATQVNARKSLFYHHSIAFTLTRNMGFIFTFNFFLVMFTELGIHVYLVFEFTELQNTDFRCPHLLIFVECIFAVVLQVRNLVCWKLTNVFLC